MSDTTEFTTRLPTRIVELIDAFAARMSRELYCPADRGDAIHVLVTTGLGRELESPPETTAAPDPREPA